MSAVVIGLQMTGARPMKFGAQAIGAVSTGTSSAMEFLTAACMIALTKITAQVIASIQWKWEKSFFICGGMKSYCFPQKDNGFER